MEYTYKARTKDGGLKTGKLEAANEMEALGKLQNMNYFVTELLGEKEKPGTFSSKGLKNIALDETKAKKIKRYKGLKNDDLILFCEQFSVLLQSGVDIIKSLDILATQATSQKLYDALLVIRNAVAGGETLSKAMTRYPDIFNKYMLNLISIGESSGTLADVILKVSQYFEKGEAIKSKVKAALIYPAVLIAVSLIAIVVFMVQVIPMFQKIFGEFNVELPQLTVMVIGMSNFVKKYLLIEIIAVAGIVFFIKKTMKNPEQRIKIDEFLLKVPILGSVILRTSVVNFCSSFNVLLYNGVSVIDTIEMVRGTLGNSFLAEKLVKVREKVKGGMPISTALDEAGEYPQLMIQMMAVGEETGHLDTMLDKLVIFYEKRVTQDVNALASIFEPLILVVMGGIIGVLVIAMFLPIFKMSQIGGG